MDPLLPEGLPLISVMTATRRSKASFSKKAKRVSVDVLEDVTPIIAPVDTDLPTSDVEAMDEDEDPDCLAQLIARAIRDKLNASAQTSAPAEATIDFSVGSSLDRLGIAHSTGTDQRARATIADIEQVPRKPFTREPIAPVKKPDTASKWFDMRAPELTPELRNDLRVIANRNFLDPKRHYKREGKKGWQAPKYFEIGTVIEGAHEFYSSRLARKDRQTSLAREVLADTDTVAYMKRKALAIAAQKPSKKKLKPTNRRRQNYT